MARELTAEQKAVRAAKARERRAAQKAAKTDNGLQEVARTVAANKAAAQAETQAPAPEPKRGAEKAGRQQIPAPTSVPEGFKRCPRCGQVKPVSEFAKNKASKDGLYSICKECESADRKKAAERRKQLEAAETPERQSARKAATARPRADLPLAKTADDFNPAVLPGSTVVSKGRSVSNVTPLRPDPADTMSYDALREEANDLIAASDSEAGITAAQHARCDALLAELEVRRAQ